MSNDVKFYEEKMNKTIENFVGELGSIRAGRANPSVLDKLSIDYYGTQTPIKQVGNVSVPEPRVIQISPYDTSTLKDIEKSIQVSDLGINPSNDGKVIRLVFPELTEERRKALTKDIKKKGDDFKVIIRNIRRDANDDFKKQQKAKEITEDDLKTIDDTIQKSTDKYIAKIDALVDEKNKDLMSI